MMKVRIGFLTRAFSPETRSSVPLVMRALVEAGAIVDVVHPLVGPTDLAGLRIQHDLYVLKQMSGLAVSLAGVLHAQGAAIVNPYPVTLALSDKIVTFRVLQRAGVPLPDTYVFSDPITVAPLLETVDLVRHFPVRDAFGRRVGRIRAVDGVSLAVWPGETLGLVGESGCGKSTLGKTVMGIYAPTAGEIRFAGREIGRLPPRERRAVARDLQYVYQDPGASLDPRWKVVHSLHEPLKIHTRLSRAEREREVNAILAAVGLPDAHLDLYPHELSGGQQRRVGLARILTLRPRMVILDEPTSGLDVSVQASVLKLFRSLQHTFALTYVFISHDLAVVRAMCARIAVIYLGTIVEVGDTAAVFAEPRHPYTRSLLAAVPRIGGRRIAQDFTLEGEPPNPRDVPSGCRFRTRCPLVQDICVVEEPRLREVDGRRVACHFAEHSRR